MKTLLLTLSLLLPLSSIADVPCYQAIQMQHDSIDSLETRLKTAQSLPYNQGYQEGYKVGKGEAIPKIDLVIGVAGIAICIGLLFGWVLHTIDN